MNKSQLNEMAAHTLRGSFSLAIEKIAKEIAKETLADEEFRESLHTLVRAASKKALAELATEQP
jgi:hypothetical protein